MKRLTALLALPLLATTALTAAPVIAKANPVPTANSKSVPPTMTEDTGRPVADNQNIKTAGVDGPALIEDYHFFEKFGHFDRERIPERVVHANGVAVKGEFVASEDFRKYSIASPFRVGKKTPVVLRFSTVLNERGSPEFARDPRGWAIKFKTDTGNWDIVGIDFPVFFIRDAMKFPDLIHSNRPDPVTNIQDLVGRFDFWANMPQNTHAMVYLYSHKFGVPRSLRHIDGFGVHAYRTIAADGKQYFVKFHFKSRQGVEGLTAEEIKHTDWAYATKDLFTHIWAGQFPKWDLYAKVLTPQQAAALPYDAFDDTKDWIGIPEMKLGTLTLNEVPENYFNWSEQFAAGPGTMIPGIYPSPDKMLQGRLFSYPDTQRYRLGANYQDLEVNRPLAPIHTNEMDGQLNSRDQKGHINYQPSSYWADPWATVDEVTPGNNGKIGDVAPASSKLAEAAYPVSGLAQAHAVSPADDFTQAGILYRSFSESDKEQLVANLKGDMVDLPWQMHHKPKHETFVRCASYAYKADPDFGTRLAKAIGVTEAELKAEVAKVDGLYVHN